MNVQICKASTPTNPVPGIFQFTVAGLTGVFTAPVGACTFPIKIEAGNVTITDLLKGAASRLV